VKYQEQLLDARWLLARDEILIRDGSCVLCASRSSLQVHHSYYVAKRMAWEYPRESLVTLCDACHGKITNHFSGNFSNWEAAACAVISAVSQTHKDHLCRKDS
jgi:5-methylcytosine-specific restriction endonuclease McrA